MFLKWVLVLFAAMSVALFVLGKAIAFMNPPRPGRPAPPLLGRVERALRWTVMIPALVALALLAGTLLSQR